MYCVTIGRAVSLTLILSSHFMADYGMTVEKPPEPNDGYLTVRQSLLAMYVMGDLTGPAAVVKQFPFNRLNPNVREYARFYLERDNTLEMNIHGAICLLGFVGNEDDISFIEQYVDKSLPRSSEALGHRGVYLQNLALFVGRFAGMMVKRDIDGAEVFLKKYAKVSSWMAPGEEATPESLSNARDLYSNFIVGAYQYSKSPYLLPLLQEKSPDPTPYFHESIVNSLKKMDMDKYTELMNQKAVPQEKLNEILAKSFERYGEWIDMLMKKQTYAQWREAHEKQKAAAKAEKKPVESFESVDMSETVEGRYLRVIARDATEAFERVSKAVLDGNAEDAPIKKELLRDIQKAGLNDYRGFQVTVDVEARVDGFSVPTDSSEGKGERGATKPTVVKEKRAAAVTFRIQGTADVFKRHVSEAGPNAPVSPATGDVMIQMQRANDAWYWGSTSGPHISAAADMVEDEYLTESVRAATVAYTQIARTLIDGNYDALTIPVVDNGKLIPLEKRKKDKDEMAKALDMEKRILEELMKTNLNTYGDHRIKIAWKATLAPGDTREEAGVPAFAVHGYETTDVTFVIRNAADVYRKHAPKGTGSDSLDKGNLRVHMKRINGQWYWNPFGW